MQLDFTYQKDRKADIKKFSKHKGFVLVELDEV